MYPADIDPQSGCRLPLPKREELGPDAQLVYDSLADPRGASLRGLRGPGGILLHSPNSRAIPARSIITCGTRRVSAAGFANWRSW